MAAQKRAATGLDGPTFYAGLEPFSDFAQLADPARYVPAPDDWLVVLADIKGSTEAARAGRYKDVNLVGAACITATLNATPGLDLPYAFGGSTGSPAGSTDFISLLFYRTAFDSGATDAIGTSSSTGRMQSSRPT